MSDPKGSLLIVEDDPEIRLVLVEILETIALKVDTAANGQLGLDKVLHGSYDCVLSDINMPVMGGLEFLAESRKHSVATPFVMVSAFGDPANLKEALKLGAMDFVDKPFDFQHIREVTRKAMDYGALVLQMDREIETLFQQMQLPSENIRKLKDMHRQVTRMKATNLLYFKAS